MMVERAMLLPLTSVTLSLVSRFCDKYKKTLKKREKKFDVSHRTLYTSPHCNGASPFRGFIRAYKP